MCFYEFKDSGSLQNGGLFSSCCISVNFQPNTPRKCFLETSCNCISGKNIGTMIFKTAKALKMAAVFQVAVFLQIFNRIQQVNAFCKV
jgi:hypothetical protein